MIRNTCVIAGPHCSWRNVVGHVVGMSDLPLPAICGEENARGFWSKLPINECVEMLPEVEPGLNKGRLKVYVSLLECVDFASLFCVLGKQNCGQRWDLFWREMFHKSARPRLTGFVDVFDEINLVFADTRTVILNGMIALRSKTVAHTSLPSFNNTNRCCFEERLLRSRNFATMVTWAHTLLSY